MADPDTLARVAIDGRPALAAYLDDEFRPVAPGAATIVKVVFTDARGGSMFLVPSAQNSK